LHWKPQVPFDDGVKKMLAVIEDWREAPLWDSDSIAEATKDWFKYLS
jgi:UDP-glucose 4-epimerase